MKVEPIIASPKTNNDEFKNFIKWTKQYKPIASGFKACLEVAIRKVN